MQQEIVYHQMDILSEQHLIDCVNRHYPIAIGQLTQLHIGADPHASVYKGQAEDGSCYFIKLKTRYHDDLSATLVSLFYDAGIKQVIPPIKTKEQTPTQDIDVGTLIVYPFVEGENGFHHPLTEEQWITLGQTLKSVHQFKLPEVIQKQLKTISYSPKWRDALRALYPYVASPSCQDPIALKLFLFMQAHEEEIHRLVDRAEQLSKKAQEHAHPAVLCHSDIHGGNVLIDQKGELFIIDWDEPILAPKERDLMFIGGGVANVWNEPHEGIAFYKGYGKTDIHQTLLAYYRHERIIEDMAIYGHALLFENLDSASKATMCQHFIDMFQPKGVVDIAFQTDDDHNDK